MSFETIEIKMAAVSAKRSIRGGLVGDTNMAAVSLFRDTNMASVTSRQNTLYQS